MPFNILNLTTATLKKVTFFLLLNIPYVTKAFSTSKAINLHHYCPAQWQGTYCIFCLNLVIKPECNI